MICWQISNVSRIIKVLIYIFIRVIITISVSIEHSLSRLSLHVIIITLTSIIWSLLSSQEIRIDLLIKIDTIILLLLAVIDLLSFLSSSHVRVLLLSHSIINLILIILTFILIPIHILIKLPFILCTSII